MMQMQLTGGVPVAVCQPAGVARRSQRTPFTQQRRLQTLQHRRRSQITVRAQEGAEEAESDDEFDQRLAAIRKNKTAPGGQRKAKTPYEQLQENKKAGSSKKDVDWGKEEVYFESAPHRGDLAVNVALGATLVWLPLTFAAIGRGIFVKYRFSDKRISVITSAPWKNEQLDAAYSEVKSVVSIGRGIGYWGDMVVELRNGDKIEMRALPRHKEMEKYINEQRQAASSQPAAASARKPSKGGATKGFGG